jgi:hypothetical protein
LLQKKCVFMAAAILIIYIYVVFTLLLMIYLSKARLDFFWPGGKLPIRLYLRRTLVLL